MLAAKLQLKVVEPISGNIPHYFRCPLRRDMHQTGKLRINLPNLLFFGFLIHVIGLLFFAALPATASAVVLHDVALPLILIYTPATALLGLMLQDVITRQLTEATLKASEERYRVIFRNTPVGNIVIDDRGVIKAFNPAASKCHLRNCQMTPASKYT